MIMGTTTATILKDGVLWVIIFLSELAFRWIPATLAVATGGATPVVPAFLEDLEKLVSTSGGEESGSVQTSTGVVLEGTHYDAAGNAVPITPDGAITSADMNTSTLSPDQAAGGAIGGVFATAWGIFTPISIFISLLLATGLVYTLIRSYQVRRAEHQALEALEEHSKPVVVGGAVPATFSNVQKRWNRIQEQIASTEENDWRLAILEADIMLDELLESLGYTGASIGDKLKQAARGDFKTRDEAWDAHVVRNHIAHRGSSHELTQRETLRVMHEYEHVFKEFGLL